jgi:hypothetical protein
MPFGKARSGGDPSLRILLPHCVVFEVRGPIPIQGFSFQFMSGSPTLEQIEVVPCPTCGAKPGEKCKLLNGVPRTDPHRERCLVAEDLLSR